MAKNSGNFQLDNLTYDLITVLHEKSKGLEAFDEYLRDAQGDNETRQCFEELRRQDQENIQRLQQLLSRRLSTQSREGERAA